MNSLNWSNLLSSEQDALTTSLMIILENGDLNPLLCLKPAWLPCFTPILVSWLASSRSKLQTPPTCIHAYKHLTHTYMYARSRPNGLPEWMCRSRCYEGFGRLDGCPH
uniref:Predicted protein n=1 Tax=Hordeum vulgare subsp. vulgare TaxID=112509 RepID=F2EK14_HORVV|nr:predicted protein [Hordeum vulgare subsp. vulgare]